MLKQLPIGNADFEEIISKNFYFVDKSLFIKELLASGSKSTLIPRPRRFGKTLNMSMLKCFFEKTEKSRAHLFDNLDISKHKDVMQHQGKYPVIFMTLKFIDQDTWDKTLEKAKQVIADEYRRHKYILESPYLDDTEKQDFHDITSYKASEVAYQVSLRKLTEYLSKYHKQKPIVLIDEYDAPIQAGFRYGYYEKITLFIRSFLGDATKDNQELEFAVLTGALRIAKEGIFTGMNNPEVCTLFDDLFSDKFGLLENEVIKLLNYYGLENDIDDVRAWYNGYSSGSYTVYNPWSIINFAKQKGRLKSYWVNVSTNDIVEKLIRNGDDEIKEDIKRLYTGESVTKLVRESTIYTDIENDETILWNFLLFTGYLTFRNIRLEPSGKTYVDYLIPNKEVRDFFDTAISSWFVKQKTNVSHDELLKSLVEGDIANFNELFCDLVLSSFSFFDTSGKQPEKFYHAFVLGMLVHLKDTHEVKSNRESGHGRYDVSLIPKDKSKLGIVIEFKKVSHFQKEKIEQAAESALNQIKERKYATDLFSQGIRSVIGIGIAFYGKEVLIQSEKLNA